MNHPIAKASFFSIVTLFLTCVAFLLPGFGQASFTDAQLRGTVQDPSRAAVPRATVVATNKQTGVSAKTTTDELGRYIFNSLRPAAYTIKIEAPGFKTVVQPSVELRVGQQADLDFTLEVGEVTSTVEVNSEAPLLNSVSAALGQEVTNRYITEVPLLDRDISNLAFLAPGVTEVQSAAYTGVNFVSNGQRNSTAEVRVDGGLTTSPDEAGGGVTKTYYRPGIEIIQEFKLQNNSFSAEYGNNGGTVINMVTKSGTNEFHGSGYWFGRRPELDANYFFSNKAGQEKPDYKRDIYGGSIGGPIFKQKTFFFFDYDRVRNIAPSPLRMTVPTALQRKGDFSQTFNSDSSLVQIFNPFDTYTDSSGTIKRRPFAGNIIPSSSFDPVAANLVGLFPEPTDDGDPITHYNNFTKNATSAAPANQYDIKIDHIFSERSRLFSRYSRHFDKAEAPRYYGTAADNFSSAQNTYQNFVLEHTWNLTPNTVWVNRVAVDRVRGVRLPEDFDPTTLGFGSALVSANGKKNFPEVNAEGYGSGGFGISLGVSGYTYTNNAHTYPSAASLLSTVKGSHNMKFGGEVKQLYVSYDQPGFPSGFFSFTSGTTREEVFNYVPGQGNGLASLLLGFMDANDWTGGGYVNVSPSAATKSQETAFFIQDDWRVTQKLTLNLGLRYEWTTPFTERYDRTQIANFNADTGVDVPGLGRIRGAAEFVDSKRRHVTADKNNIAPRVGLAYRFGPNTVLRAGAGVYYNIAQAPSDWRAGPAYRKTAALHPSLDGGITRYATLANPFPDGLKPPQGRKYGTLNLWGFTGDVGLSEGIRNAEIYQWNLSLQHQLTDSILLETAYTGSRSTHLEFYGTSDVNFIDRETARKYGSAGLFDLVDNPFLPLFKGPKAIFDEPESFYSQPQIFRSNLLRPFPQFNGGFSGIMRPVANARYNALQFRFEKRYSQGLNLIGSYTFSKLMDNSSNGSNGNWVGNVSSLQDITNLSAEKSVGASDTPHRLVFGGSYELPIGRQKPVGRNMNRVVNGVVGGWQVNGFLTFQSGFPLQLYSFNPISVGSQRPNLGGNPWSQYSIKDVVDGKGYYFNFNQEINRRGCNDPSPGAICAPLDFELGNAPRFNSDLRGDMIHNLDLSIFKNFNVRENMKLQLRAEFFNFTNTPRFTNPDTGLGNSTFGTITGQLNAPRLSQIGVRFLF